MRIGAAGVVAPLWNVRDDVAAAVARAFYAAALGAEPVPAAEAMRAVRATYTEAAARAEDPQQHATLVAYQVFGHPRLMLTQGERDG
jgi:CHAT domain-containing protein